MLRLFDLVAVWFAVVLSEAVVAVVVADGLAALSSGLFTGFAESSRSALAARSGVRSSALITRGVTAGSVRSGDGSDSNRACNSSETPSASRIRW